MPVVIQGKPVLTGAANVMMAMAYRPRVKNTMYTKLTRFTRSTRLVEPYPFYGSVPMMKNYIGTVAMSSPPSFQISIPNILQKAGMWMERTEVELDQTRSLLRFVSDFGVRLSEAPDMLLIKRILNGSSQSAVNITIPGATPGYSGQYQYTLDGQPPFSTNHTNYFTGGAVSNIIQGNLPATISALNAQTPATTVQQLTADMNLIINQISSVADTAGVPMYSNFDAGQSLIILGPKTMDTTLTLAFAKQVNGQATIVNQTTNVLPQFVKDVITSSYFSGIPDPELQGSTMITPVNPTDYYAIIVDDYVAPFYSQAFAPVSENDVFPRGYDVNGEIDRMLDSLGDTSPASVAAATFYSSAIIDMNLNRQGSNADAEMALRERGFIIPRVRYNIGYGPWFTYYRIKPVGGA